MIKRISLFAGIVMGSWSIQLHAQGKQQMMLNDSLKTRVIQARGDEPLVKKGEIRYVQEERIGLVDDYLRAEPIKQDGYRIQLIFGDRNEVSSSRSRFLSKWEYPAYETYLAPNFRLRVGDFMNRYQAEKALRQLREDFPNAYIVRDKIEVPKAFRGE